MLLLYLDRMWNGWGLAQRKVEHKNPQKLRTKSALWIHPYFYAVSSGLVVNTLELRNVSKMTSKWIQPDGLQRWKTVGTIYVIAKKVLDAMTNRKLQVSKSYGTY